ncbi:MAG: hypothetical protein FJ010_12810 [Chloroflexi bacterium]|nr:hypothetical protein [Chloroflexota bacterium]
MQIRCFKCQMPIALGRDAVAEALEVVEKEDLSHYDVRCPKCRTTNRISRKQLSQFAPREKTEKKE